MDDKELKSFTRQVLRNCDISDADHAGFYSICGLALRLRDLYKWENQLPPWGLFLKSSGRSFISL
jgi:hypothetical protein